jgi:hypothetical protein
VTATLTADAGWLVRASVCPRRIRVEAPPSAPTVQLGLVVDVLDDGLTKLRLGNTLLNASQRVPDDVAGREG